MIAFLKRLFRRLFGIPDPAIRIPKDESNIREWALLLKESGKEPFILSVARGCTRKEAEEGAAEAIVNYQWKKGAFSHQCCQYMVVPLRDVLKQDLPKATVVS